MILRFSSRAEEAVLAFIGNAECGRKPWRNADYTEDNHVKHLIEIGAVEIDGEYLKCTIAGWRFLDNRP